LRLETEAPIDDILIHTDAGGFVFIQAKTSVNLSSDAESVDELLLLNCELWLARRRCERLLLPLGREKGWLPPDPTGMFMFPKIPAELLTSYPVTPKINRATFNEPAAIRPLDPAIQ
jgi:hypothetical protein